MIVEANGRRASVRTIEEQRKLLEQEIASLKPEERQALMVLMNRGPDATCEVMAAMDEYDYRSPIVGIEEFVREDYFLGKQGKSLYPVLMEDLKEITSGSYSEVIWTGSTAYGKSFASRFLIWYEIYRLIEMREPAPYFGLAPGSPIVVAMLTMTIKLADRIIMQPMKQLIADSEYFQNVGYGGSRDGMSIRFANAITMIAGGASPGEVIGNNVFSALLDEAAFMEAEGEGKASYVASKASRAGSRSETSAQALYASIQTRRKGRFMKQGGRLPGQLVLVSSARSEGDLHEQRLHEAVDDPSIFVRERVTWEVRPGDFGPGRFRLYFGGAKENSRILKDDEPDPVSDDPKARVIPVPLEWKPDFERALERSIRDIAGVATTRVDLFMHRTDKIEAAFKTNVSRQHPFTTTEWISGGIGDFVWERFAKWDDVYEGREHRIVWSPMHHPNAPRHVALDLAKNRDCVGIAVGCVPKWVNVVRRDDELRTYTELAPFIWVDLVLRVRAQKGGEIGLGLIRGLVYQLQEHGFNIVSSTIDTWQSLDTQQQFNQRGIVTRMLSVDTSDQPYGRLREALYEDRVDGYPYEPVEIELKSLKHDIVLGRVDHSAKNLDGSYGSKDVADALASLVEALSEPKRLELPLVQAGKTSVPPDDHDRKVQDWTNEILLPMRG